MREIALISIANSARGRSTGARQGTVRSRSCPARIGRLESGPPNPQPLTGGHMYSSTSALYERSSGGQQQPGDGQESMYQNTGPLYDTPRPSNSEQSAIYDVPRGSRQAQSGAVSSAPEGLYDKILPGPPGAPEPEYVNTVPSALGGSYENVQSGPNGGRATTSAGPAAQEGTYQNVQPDSSDSAPAGSAPAGSAPAGSAPAGSPPAGSAPAGSPPAGSAEPIYMDIDAVLSARSPGPQRPYKPYKSGGKSKVAQRLRKMFRPRGQLKYPTVRQKAPLTTESAASTSAATTSGASTSGRTESLAPTPLEQSATTVTAKKRQAPRPPTQSAGTASATTASRATESPPQSPQVKKKRQAPLPPTQSAASSTTARTSESSRTGASAAIGQRVGTAHSRSASPVRPNTPPPPVPTSLESPTMPTEALMSDLKGFFARQKEQAAKDGQASASQSQASSGTGGFALGTPLSLLARRSDASPSSAPSTSTHGDVRSTRQQQEPTPAQPLSSSATKELQLDSSSSDSEC